jgi:hypothetical protein
MTSEDAVLVLDEPDVFAFPPYPKMLGEMIAADETNQFFLTTHNPYFLAGIVEKAPRNDLAVFVCHRDAEGATAAKLLSDQDLSRVIEPGGERVLQSGRLPRPMTVFAYECYADGDVFRVLKGHCGLPLDGFHGFGQGPLVEAVLVKETADIGMVDEDPLSSHHRERDRMESVRESPSLEVRRRRGRHLLVVRPELETCVLRSMRLAGIPSQLGERPADLRTFLNLPMHPKHRIFQQELVRDCTRAR